MGAHQLEVLDEQLQDETVELSQEEVSEKFKIENLEGLDWAFRKVAIYQSELAEQEEYARNEIERITSWLTKEREKAERNIGYFEYLAAEYLKEQMANNPKKKSISTPHGKIQSTTSKPAIVKPDDATITKLIDYAEENGFSLLVEEKKSLKWAEFKKELQLKEVGGKKIIIDSNGQIVEGIPVNEGGTSFKITI